MLLDSHPSINSLPISPTWLWNFNSFLFFNKYSPSSIASHVLVISYVHKMLGTACINTFLVKKVMQGCHHIAPPCKEDRLPITGFILLKLIQGLKSKINIRIQRIPACRWMNSQGRGFRRHNDITGGYIVWIQENKFTRCSLNYHETL